MTQDSWTNSQTVLLQQQLLEAIAEATAGGYVPAIATYADRLGASVDAVVTAAGALRSAGLIAGERSLAGPPSLAAQVTRVGATELAKRRDRRSNARDRALACRDALLDWCYEAEAADRHPGLDEFSTDVRAHFEGDPFTQAEVIRASEHLRELNLISGASAWGAGVVRPNITAAGRDVVENHGSSIVSRTAAQQSSNRGVTINLHGPMEGQISIGDHNSMTQHARGINYAELGQLLRDVAAAAVGTPEEENAGRVVAALQLELQEEEPSAEIAQKNLSRLESIAAKAGSAALTSSVAQLVAAIGSALGGNSN